MVLHMSEVKFDESHYTGTTCTVYGENEVQKGEYIKDLTENSCPNWESITRRDKNPSHL